MQAYFLNSVAVTFVGVALVVASVVLLEAGDFETNIFALLGCYGMLIGS
jgi:hypothetical protein